MPLPESKAAALTLPEIMIVGAMSGIAWIVIFLLLLVYGGQIARHVQPSIDLKVHAQTVYSLFFFVPLVVAIVGSFSSREMRVLAPRIFCAWFAYLFLFSLGGFTQGTLMTAFERSLLGHTSRHR
ncbi:MAG: hypothetical protein JSS86_20415 [Cyanobacteria bacterium SZAS LIN-2]|nr:hypothetical protein [Cyanobacteria bacterium SZAS LIN-2]